MHELLAHRGPDGEGYFWVDRQMRANSVHGECILSPEIPQMVRAAAAFRWLKIQDTGAASNQPMSSRNGKLWLLFNGEIYNHKELRGELQRAGTVFQTESDTEVVLEAYRQWGTACFSRFNGMWAILLFDLEQRRLVISRDRLGIKPLFFSWDTTRLLFAAEPKAVALARKNGPFADPFRVHEFLRGLPPQSAQLTFFRDVHPVPAGTWAEISLDADKKQELNFCRFWDLADYRMQNLPEEDFEDKREEFEVLLQDVVRDHSHAAVSVGTLLSGGLDTSILARLLAKTALSQGKPSPGAYSIIFEEPQMSEWPYMQLVLAQGGLRGVNFVLQADTAWNSTEAVVRAQGHPLLGQDLIAQYHAYRLARENGSIVVLDGQGSDELLAGMPLYEAQIFPEMLRRGRFFQFAVDIRARMRRYGMSLRETLNVYLRNPLSRRYMENHGLPTYAWLDSDRFDSSSFGSGRTNDWGPEVSALTRYLYRHVRHTNLPAVLMYQDHSSMSHGVESRVPFLDHRIVEFIFQLPERFKLRRGIRKRILLETARKYLPAAIVERRDKRIFISKLSWMQLRIKRLEELREMAASNEMRTFAMFRPGQVQRCVDDYLSGKHNDEMAIWRLYTLWHWLRQFRPSM